MMEVLTVNLLGKVRQARRNGREYLVAPLSLIVPGVLNGSKGALMYPEDEVAKHASIWNDIPLVVYHPTDNGGNPLSANDPDVIDRSGIGFATKSVYNGKQVAEGWFDIAAMKRIDNRIYESLKHGHPIELSTGLYTDNEPAPAGSNHKGKPYTHIARNYRADHIAILPDVPGACSINDGCGVLVNRANNNSHDEYNIVGNVKDSKGHGSNKKELLEGMISKARYSVSGNYNPGNSDHRAHRQAIAHELKSQHDLGAADAWDEAGDLVEGKSELKDHYTSNAKDAKGHGSNKKGITLPSAELHKAIKDRGEWEDDIAEKFGVGKYAMEPEILAQAIRAKMSFRTTSEGGVGGRSWQGIISFEKTPSPELKQAAFEQVHGHVVEASPTEFHTSSNTRVAHEGTADRVRKFVDAGYYAMNHPAPESIHNARALGFGPNVWKGIDLSHLPPDVKSVVLGFVDSTTMPYGRKRQAVLDVVGEYTSNTKDSKGHGSNPHTANSWSEAARQAAALAHHASAQAHFSGTVADHQKAANLHAAVLEHTGNSGIKFKQHSGLMNMHLAAVKSEGTVPRPEYARHLVGNSWTDAARDAAGASRQAHTATKGVAGSKDNDSFNMVHVALAHATNAASSTTAGNNGKAAVSAGNAAKAHRAAAYHLSTLSGSEKAIAAHNGAASKHEAIVRDYQNVTMLHNGGPGSGPRAKGAEAKFMEHMESAKSARKAGDSELREHHYDMAQHYESAHRAYAAGQNKAGDKHVAAAEARAANFRPTVNGGPGSGPRVGQKVRINSLGSEHHGEVGHIHEISGDYAAVAKGEYRPDAYAAHKPNILGQYHKSTLITTNGGPGSGPHPSVIKEHYGLDVSHLPKSMMETVGKIHDSAIPHDRKLAGINKILDHFPQHRQVHTMNKSTIWSKLGELLGITGNSKDAKGHGSDKRGETQSAYARSNSDAHTLSDRAHDLSSNLGGDAEKFAGKALMASGSGNHEDATMHHSSAADAHEEAAESANSSWFGGAHPQAGAPNSPAYKLHMAAARVHRMAGAAHNTALEAHGEMMAHNAADSPGTTGQTRATYNAWSDEVGRPAYNDAATQAPTATEDQVDDVHDETQAHDVNENPGDPADWDHADPEDRMTPNDHERKATYHEVAAEDHAAKGRDGLADYHKAQAEHHRGKAQEKMSGIPSGAGSPGVSGVTQNTEAEAITNALDLVLNQEQDSIILATYNRAWPKSKRDKTPAHDFAGPHESFPIADQADVEAAAHLVGKAADPEAVKSRIKSIAKSKGLSVPEAWINNSGWSDAAREAAIASRNAHKATTSANEVSNQKIGYSPSARAAGQGSAANSKLGHETVANFHDQAADAHDNATEQHYGNWASATEGHAQASMAHRSAAELHRKAAGMVNNAKDPKGHGSNKKGVERSDHIQKIGSDDKQPMRVLGGYDISQTGSVMRGVIPPTAAGQDHGADPVGDGTFKMVPSGDVVDLAERNKRLSRFTKNDNSEQTSVAQQSHRFQPDQTVDDCGPGCQCPACKAKRAITGNSEDVTLNQGDATMATKKEVIDMLVANCGCQENNVWTESDRPILNAMSDERLIKLLKQRQKLAITANAAGTGGGDEDEEESTQGRETLGKKGKKKPPGNTAPADGKNGEDNVDDTAGDYAVTGNDDDDATMTDNQLLFKELLAEKRGELLNRLIANAAPDKKEQAAVFFGGMTLNQLRAHAALTPELVVTRQSFRPMPQYVGAAGGPQLAVNAGEQGDAGENLDMTPPTINYETFEQHDGFVYSKNKKARAS